MCREGLIYGAVVSLRLLSVMAAGTLVVFTTYPSDLILAMTKLRVPHSFAFMLTLSLRFLPETVEQGKRILVAQQLRGAGGKGFVSAVGRFRFLVVPLLAMSLRSARQVALAAEIRAYSANRIPSKRLAFHDCRLGGYGWTCAIDGRWRHGGPARTRRIARRDEMILLWLYFASVLGLLAAIGTAVVLGVRKRAFQPFTTLELATAAVSDMPAARCRRSLANWFGQGARFGCVGVLDSLHGHFPAGAASGAETRHLPRCSFSVKDFSGNCLAAASTPLGGHTTCGAPWALRFCCLSVGGRVRTCRSCSRPECSGVCSPTLTCT